MFRELSGLDIEIDYVDYKDQYQTILDSASTYDVISLDQLWLADLMTKELLTPLNDYIPRKIRADIPSVILNAFKYRPSG